MEKGTFRLLFLILGLFFIITSYIMSYQLLRIIILVLGILCSIISNIIERKYQKLAIIFYTFIILILIQFIDYINIKYFNKEPLLIYNVKEFENIKVYDSIFYRVWQCDKEKNEYTIDNLDKIGYFCDLDYVNSTNINNYAVELITNYNRYNNTYIKLNGIIYDVNDQYIILKTYIYKNEKLIFNDNLTIKIYKNDFINTLKVNDEIEIVGKISKLGNKTVYLEDAVI